jgi:chromosome segregation protein
MEESGITKVISVKLKNEELAVVPEPVMDAPLVEDEDVEAEEGRDLPVGIDDPALVSEAELRPIRAAALDTHGLSGNQAIV